ncbi:MAG: hypothetical protein F4Y18_03500 [Cenarchaeum sp. SB0663_bin_5]|nr:hypothetical protein [Cenarchaeum sp. SB0663_bin_5]MYL11739.1 hypothetical protein [Cenarchaeum sp. SB0669_bin_11]
MTNDPTAITTIKVRRSTLDKLNRSKRSMQVKLDQDLSMDEFLDTLADSAIIAATAPEAALRDPEAS